MMDLGHKKLEIWKRSVKLVGSVYGITSDFPPDERFGLTNQARRAAVSTPANIAEGASRGSSKERRRYYEVARSSIAELDTHFEIAIELGYKTESELNPLTNEMTEIFAMLSGMMSNTR